MTIVANTYAHVIGIDTHARVHTLTVLDAATGARLATGAFPTTRTGLARALTWITRHTDTTITTLVVIEGIGSYGASIAREARQARLRVVEPLPTPKGLRSGRGKSDPIDAELIARSVLATDVTRLREPRDDEGIRAAVRILIGAREHLVRHRTACVNELTALVRTVNLGLDGRHALTATQIAVVASWRERDEDLAAATARTQARVLAKTIRALDIDLKTNHARLTELVEASPVACLLDEVGIGAVNAGIIYTAWSHEGRIRSEAAFANLAGVSPLPASSGNTSRHRLNRGGDRRLNRALHSITLTRMRLDPATRDYVERRRGEGKTIKEIRRVLKRYLARHIYRELAHATA